MRFKEGSLFISAVALFTPLPTFPFGGPEVQG